MRSCFNHLLFILSLVWININPSVAQFFGQQKQYKPDNKYYDVMGLKRTATE